MTDFDVYPDGTVWLFHPATDDARAFVEERLELEPWQWLGRAFACDHNNAPALYNYLASCGFNMGVSYGCF